MLDAAVVLVQMVLSVFLAGGAFLVLSQLYSESGPSRATSRAALLIVEGGVASNSSGSPQYGAAPEQPKIAA